MSTPESSPAVAAATDARPRDIIDFIQARGAERGEIMLVNRAYYQAFIDLPPERVEQLVLALMVDQRKMVRGLARGGTDAAAVAKVTDAMSSILLSLEMGLACFDSLGQLVFVSPEGPGADELGLEEDLQRWHDSMRPVLRRTVRHALPWLLAGPLPSCLPSGAEPQVGTRPPTARRDAERRASNQGELEL